MDHSLRGHDEARHKDPQKATGNMREQREASFREEQSQEKEAKKVEGRKEKIQEKHHEKKLSRSVAEGRGTSTEKTWKNKVEGRMNGADHNEVCLSSEGSQL